MKRTITSKMLPRFRQYLKENERSKTTICKYLHDVTTFKIFSEDNEIDRNTVLAYKAELSKKYAITSANSMLAALNSFFHFYHWEELVVKYFPIQKKVYCSETKELSKPDYFNLLKASAGKRNERLNLLIQTLCGTGIRVSELPFITVEALEAGEAVITCKGKTRTVFIVSKLKSKLFRYAKSRKIDTGPIFITRSGKPMDRSNIWREMKKLCDQSGVPSEKVFPHNLRHLFARIFYSLDKDIARLSDVLGHSSIDTTRMYIISTGAEHRRQMENMRLII